MTIELQVVEGNCSEFDDVYARFVADFPPQERLEKSRMEFLMSQGQYKLVLAKHPQSGELIGYAFVFEPDSPKIIWLDYIAIDAQCRNSGYGSLFFDILAQRRPGENLGVFIEVEKTSTDNSEDAPAQQRRITFYEKRGAIRIPMDYQLPTEHGGFPMHLYVRPAPNVARLPKETIQAAIVQAFEVIHGHKPHRSRVLKTISNTVKDVQF